MTFLQAFVIVTELFPVSSLGHSVLVPAWLGGSWRSLVTQSSQQNSESSFYLSYVVALHCATALALMWFFRADWAQLIRGFARSLPRSLRQRRLAVADTDERLAWMIVFATIPVGLTGVALEHTFRTMFAKPSAAAVLLFVNGLILAAAELLRRSARRRRSEPATLTMASSVPARAAARTTASAGAIRPSTAPGRPQSHRKTARPEAVQRSTPRGSPTGASPRCPTSMAS